MKLEDIIPITGFPITGGPTCCEDKWQGIDSEEQYRKNGHPVYGENDVVYRYNRHGYRGPDFDAVGDIRMISVGCSWVFGVGLAGGDIFHEVFAERLRRETGQSVVNFNLGMSGGSGNYVARMLHTTVDKLDPHIVLVMFPQFARREYMAPHGVRMNITPAFVPKDLVWREIYDHFMGLSSTLDDQLNFYHNYSSVAALLAGRTWLFSFTNKQDFRSMSDYVDHSRYAGEYEFVDRARDNAHPGPNTHRIIADNFWNKFVDTGGLANVTFDP
jgi:hypothetical protein